MSSGVALTMLVQVTRLCWIRCVAMTSNYASEPEGLPTLDTATILKAEEEER